MAKSKKSHKQMDRTSASFARDLDERRERNKKRLSFKKRRDASSLSRGGFR